MIKTPSSEKASISEMDTQHTPNSDIDSLRSTTFGELIKAYDSIDLFHRRKPSYYKELGRRYNVVNLLHPDSTEVAINKIKRAMILSMDYCQMPTDAVVCKSYYITVLCKILNQSLKSKLQFDSIMTDLDDIISPAKPTEEQGIDTFLLHRMESDNFPKLGELSLRRSTSQF